METLIYTVNVLDGASRSHYTLPYNSYDLDSFDTKEQLLYDKNNHLIVGFKIADNPFQVLGTMKYALIKFYDTLNPIIPWAL